jgi:glycosyltransferase involved in cell wall biosynthesis
MSGPSVSIGLPVYNGENFLAAAIESILAQDHQNFELIISDNASEDRTPAICQQYCRRDDRIRYLRSDTNRGAASNYNQVFKLSSASFFKWQAHDDICLPGFISSSLNAFEIAPASTVLVYPRAEVIDADGNRDARFVPESLATSDPLPHRRLADVLRNLNMACPVFGLIRSSALRKTRLIGSFIASDYVLLAELAMLGGIWEIPEVLFQRRVHPKISTYAHSSPADLLRWFDPSKRPSRALHSPMLALGGQYLKSINHLPLDPTERLHCRVTALSVWYGRELRILGGKYKQQVKRALR